MSSDPRRDVRGPGPDADAGQPTSKIDELLLLGLDHYFGARYEQAIHVWTRALFLDRGHARARAYIERARNAIAEQQREVEALLHEGVDALDRGDVGAARQLVTSAVERGGLPDDALAVLGRLDRLEPPSALLQPSESHTRRQAETREPGRAVSRRRRSLLALPSALLLVGATAAAVIVWQRVSPLDLLIGAEPRALVLPVAEDPIPVPRASEISMARARVLFNRGHLHESLRELDTVPVDDPSKADADRLRAAIQKSLLTGGAPPSSTPPATAGPPAADR